jgi:hypothetical protein
MQFNSMYLQTCFFLHESQVNFYNWELLCLQKRCCVNDTIRRSEKPILTLMIIFRVKINVAIYIEPRNGVKIFQKWVLGMSIFTQNLTRPPLRRKQNILKYRVYCIQKNRLCNTVSTKQSIN